MELLLLLLKQIAKSLPDGLEQEREDPSPSTRFVKANGEQKGTNYMDADALLFRTT